MTTKLPQPDLRRTCSGYLDNSLSSSTSRSHGRTTIQMPLRPQNNKWNHFSTVRRITNKNTILILYFKHTVSLHESAEVAVPVSRRRLSHVHAIKVKIRHHVVFGIAGHVDHLQKKKRHFIRHKTLNWSWTCLKFCCLSLSFTLELKYESSISVSCDHKVITHKLLTLQFCSQKDFGTNWTGKWVLMSRGEVGRLSTMSFPAWRDRNEKKVTQHILIWKLWHISMHMFLCFRPVN